MTSDVGGISFASKGLFPGIEFILSMHSIRVYGLKLCWETEDGMLRKGNR